MPVWGLWPLSQCWPSDHKFWPDPLGECSTSQTAAKCLKCKNLLVNMWFREDSKRASFKKNLTMVEGSCVNVDSSYTDLDVTFSHISKLNVGSLSIWVKYLQSNIKQHPCLPWLFAFKQSYIEHLRGILQWLHHLSRYVYIYFVRFSRMN